MQKASGKKSGVFLLRQVRVGIIMPAEFKQLWVGLYRHRKRVKDILDVKKEKYCQARSGGKSQRQAYLEAYPSSKKWKPETIDSKACNLEKDTKVSARLRELAEENSKAAGLTRKKLLDKLEDIINTDDVAFKGNEVLKAIELYADMCGYRQPESEDKLDKIKNNIEHLTDIIARPATERKVEDFE